MKTNESQGTNAIRVRLRASDPEPGQNYIFSEEPPAKPRSPKLLALLSGIISKVVKEEDATKPLEEGMDTAAYIAERARWFREPLKAAIHAGGIEVTGDELNDICQTSASEVYVVRVLGRALYLGEVGKSEIAHLDLYANHKKYFEDKFALRARFQGPHPAHDAGMP